MDKRIIFSVAGSGKTSLIINKLDMYEKSMILTYTDNNLLNLKSKIIEKFGFMPDTIKVYSYFTFLYSFCYRPFLALKVKAKGINWDVPPLATQKMPRGNMAFYLDGHRRLYHNRIAKLLETKCVYSEIVHRLEKYFDNLYVDEVQDFGGHDFNVLNSIACANLNILFVGDYFQHTFDTSRDGNTNSNLHDDYEKYKKRFVQMGLIVDLDTLSKSHRCGPSVCNFISKNIGIEISSHRQDVTNIELIECQEKADLLFHCNKRVKLFYQEHDKYNCYSENWGGSKGQDCYKSVCVILNKNTFKLFSQGKLKDLNPKTKNKFYVACTRSSEHLYLVPDVLYQKYKQ